MSFWRNKSATSTRLPDTNQTKTSADSVKATKELSKDLRDNSSGSDSDRAPVIYSAKTQGPYVVFAEPIDVSKVKGRLHPTTVGRLISASY